eukprot:141459-Chlamydomonas_euryale.AAC.1
MLTDVARRLAVIEGLEREYRNCLSAKGGEFDEREFLVRDFSALASPRMSPMAFFNAAQRAHLSPMPPVPFGRGGAPPPKLHTPKQQGGSDDADAPQQQPRGGAAGPLLAAGLQSPLPMARLAMSGGNAPSATPVTETLAAAHWLRNAVKGVPADPPRLLCEQLEELAGRDAPARVARNARELAEAALPDDLGRGTPSAALPAASMLGFPSAAVQFANLRRAEALKLYYLVLSAALSAEGGGTPAGSALLLATPKFHAGLVMCASEVVVAACRMPSPGFHAALGRLSLPAFDLVKVVQPFVRLLTAAVPGAQMPRELKRHLFVIEERIVESLAWAPGSPLYTLLRAAADTMRTQGQAAVAASGGGAEAAVLSGGAADAESRDSGCDRDMETPGPGRGEADVEVAARRSMPPPPGVAEDRS